MKIISLENTTKDLNELENYVKDCIKSKKEFYFFHLHESHLSYPKTIQERISQYKKLFIEKSIGDYNMCKFILSSYFVDIVNNSYTKNCPRITFENMNSDKDGILINHINKVLVDNKVFYTSFFRGDQNELTLTIPTDIFDNWDLQKYSPITESINIIEKINENENSQIIYKILEVFNLDSDSLDDDFNDHKNSDVIFELLKKFDVC